MTAHYAGLRRAWRATRGRIRANFRGAHLAATILLFMVNATQYGVVPTRGCAACCARVRHAATTMLMNGKLHTRVSAPAVCTRWVAEQDVNCNRCKLRRGSNTSEAREQVRHIGRATEEAKRVGVASECYGTPQTWPEARLAARAWVAASWGRAGKWRLGTARKFAAALRTVVCGEWG